jgi:hypothetical protein
MRREQPRMGLNMKRYALIQPHSGLLHLVFSTPDFIRGYSYLTLSGSLATKLTTFESSHPVSFSY